jgi:HAD superfamily hydrolase (TIGR01490 family)
MVDLRKSCAFFDIDGTLLQGFIIQAFPQFLAINRFIEPKYSKQIDEVASNYSSGSITYREAAEVVPSIYASALKGKKLNDVKKFSKEFMETYLPERIFPFSKQLIDEIGKLVDVTIALSGSPHDVVANLESLGFDKVYGSVFDKNEEIYTGEVVANLILGEQKARFAQNISRDLGIDLSQSIAFGDTDQDALMLSLVGLPIAINPNTKLQEICEKKGWKLFTTEDLKKLEFIIEWINEKRQS